MKRLLILFLATLVSSGCASKRQSKFTGSPAIPAPNHDALGGATHATVPAVNGKSQSEIEEASHRLDGLRAYLRRSYPALHLESKDQLWEAGVAFVIWLGLDIDSPRGAARLENTLSSLIVPAKDSSPSQWLFKGTLHANAHSSMPTETVVYGIATLTQTNENVVIVSHPGKTIINFRGILKAGQLQGQLTLAAESSSFAGHVEGLVSPEKIFLNSDGQAEGRPVQGTFILLR